MDEFCTRGKGSSRRRCERAVRYKVFDELRDKKLLKTTADDLRRVHADSLLWWSWKDVPFPRMFFGADQQMSPQNGRPEASRCGNLDCLRRRESIGIIITHTNPHRAFVGIFA